MPVMQLGGCNTLYKLYLGCALIFCATVLQGTVRGQGLTAPTVSVMRQLMTVLRTAKKLPKLPTAADGVRGLAVMMHWSSPSGF